ncbi:MAG: hypothetical protein ACYCSH_07875 [Acidithiobacillus sp.]
MSNLQHVAERIFRHVDAGRLPAGYAQAFAVDEACRHRTARPRREKGGER